MQVSDLHECTWLTETVANRIWTEWWRDDRAVENVRSKIMQATRGHAFPFVLVAHEKGEFIGTVSVVETNMAPRRDLSPWLSALWVEVAHRRAGIGSTLVNAAIKQAAERGRSPVYLTTTKTGSDFYRRRGWFDVPSRSAEDQVMEYRGDKALMN